MLKLTLEAMRQIFPSAPQAVLEAFVAKQHVLTKAGINQTRTRLAYFFANIEHECGGFTIPMLTENINYTAERMAQVWPNRFSSAAAVRAKYGTSLGWQKKAFDSIYGNRMGNRPGTSDGSRYIGRGGPQITGRDGYDQVGKRAGLDLVNSPELASSFDVQPEICAAFWSWKNLNAKADIGDFDGLVKLWNGGTNGMADRKHRMAGNDPAIRRLSTVTDIAQPITDLPEEPTQDQAPEIDMAWLQASLNKLGATPVLVVDGIIGRNTRKAVRDFQAKKSLKVDGIAGPATIGAMKVALAAINVPLPPDDPPPEPGFWEKLKSIFTGKA